MKVMAINSSARVGKESKTEIVLDHLVKGMREAGADVDVVNLQKKKINYCIGCFTCWSKTPGQCIHKDDMSKELFPKYVESDLIVMATPLYHYTVNALLPGAIHRNPWWLSRLRVSPSTRSLTNSARTCTTSSRTNWWRKSTGRPLKS